MHLTCSRCNNHGVIPARIFRRANPIPSGLLADAKAQGIAAALRAYGEKDRVLAILGAS